MKNPIYAEFAKNLKASFDAYHLCINIGYARKRYVDEEGDGDVDEFWYELAEALHRRRSEQIEKVLRHEGAGATEGA